MKTDTATAHDWWEFRDGDSHVFKAKDFGRAFTPELREAEERAGGGKDVEPWGLTRSKTIARHVDLAGPRSTMW